MRIPHVCALAVMLLSWESLAPAAEPAEAETPQTESTREALLQSLLGDDPLNDSESEPSKPESSEDSQEQESKPTGHDTTPGSEEAEQLTEYARLAQRLREELAAAQIRLSEGETGTPTQTAQTEAIAATERLIELAKQSANSSSDSESDASGSPSGGPGGSDSANGSQASSESQPDDAGLGTADATRGTRNREGKAEESSQRPAQEREPGAVLSAFRAAVIEHSWGHLPERIRARMLNGGGDKSLPRYETLVNQYFESLVRPERGDSLNDEP